MHRIISQSADAFQIAFDFAELATMPIPELAEIGITITPLPQTQDQWWSELEYYKRIPNRSGIYAIVNTLNMHTYIGSAVSLSKRKGQHFRSLRRNKHHSRYLQRAYDLYGLDTFRFVIIEHVEHVEKLIEREQHYIDTIKPEYNIAPNAGSALGVKHTEEARKRMSEGMKGKKREPFSEEHKARMSEAAKGNTKGKGHSHPQSEESRKKISEANKGRTQSEETKKKISVANKGKTMSEEHKTQIGAASKGNTYAKGHKHTEESKAKQSEAMKGNTNCKGRILSEETRRKMSESQKGRTHSEETKTKIGAASKNRNKGKPSPNKGKPISEETRKNISEAMKGKPSPKKGKPLSPASIEKREATRRAKREADPTYGKKKTK